MYIRIPAYPHCAVNDWSLLPLATYAVVISIESVRVWLDEIWGVTKGGSPKYKAAEAEYKRLCDSLKRESRQLVRT